MILETQTATNADGFCIVRTEITETTIAIKVGLNSDINSGWNMVGKRSAIRTYACP